MLESLFGNAVIEKVLFSLLINKNCYGSELKKSLSIPLYSIQNALKRLEKGGVVVSTQKGKTRIFQFNPRYPFLQELEAFLKKAYSFLPQEIRQKYYETPKRTRPRRSGKPL